MPKMIYSWGANGLISQTQYNLDSISRAGSRGKTLWYHYGPQGETRQLTNSLGAVVDSYTYTAYGSLVSSSGSDINPFKFGGKYGYYTDGSSGIMLAGQRWYHPVLSRWLSRDPIGYDGGENLYGYVGGNPVGLVDPSGLDPDDEDGDGVSDAHEKDIKFGFSILPGLTGGIDLDHDGRGDVPEIPLLGGGCNTSSQAILRNGYYEVNGFKFSQAYYERLWQQGRGAPSLVAREILSSSYKILPDLKPGFNKYVIANWEMIYNPETSEVWHIQPIKRSK